MPGALSVNLTTWEASGFQEDPRNLTVGVAGVHRLCKALLSAGYVKASLEEWGEDIVSSNLSISSCKRIPLIEFNILSSFSYSCGQSLAQTLLYTNGQRQILFYPTGMILRQRDNRKRYLKR